MVGICFIVSYIGSDREIKHSISFYRDFVILSIFSYNGRIVFLWIVIHSYDFTLTRTLRIRLSTLTRKVRVRVNNLTRKVRVRVNNLTRKVRVRVDNLTL